MLGRRTGPNRDGKRSRPLSAGRPPGPTSHIYGPVPSRRLGFSLGVDILPYKTCSFDCIYCQLGRSDRKSGRRGRYFSSPEILSQIKEAIDRNPQIDHITFSGSGEPTLNIRIGKLIREIKKMTHIPVVVLTNSSLLTCPAVRRALRAADIVVPSLDAATAASFRRVNRPHPSFKVADIIAGLALFRREFSGRLWLEVMLVKGVNDSPSDIRALKKAIALIRPDKIQLNTVVRPPAERWAWPLGSGELKTIAKDLGSRAEVVADFRRRPGSRGGRDLKRAILAITGRRPVTLADLTSSLGRGKDEIRPHLETLLRWNRVRPRRHKGAVYYSAAEPELNSEKRSPGIAVGNREDQ
jgi:wyosine [tRNA(Phe)-imidazoG37] synthetase (radical SAM superfamily)